MKYEFKKQNFGGGILFSHEASLIQFLVYMIVYSFDIEAKLTLNPGQALSPSFPTDKMKQFITFFIYCLKIFLGQSQLLSFKIIVIRLLSPLLNFFSSYCFYGIHFRLTYKMIFNITLIMIRPRVYDSIRKEHVKMN